MFIAAFFAMSMIFSGVMIGENQATSEQNLSSTQIELQRAYQEGEALVLQEFLKEPQYKQPANVKKAISFLGIKYPVYVSERQSASAFGFIMLNVNDANRSFEEICFILSHEQGHLELNHVKMSMLASLSRQYQAVGSIDLLTLKEYILPESVQTAYSHEFASDAYAKQLLASKGIWNIEVVERIFLSKQFVQETTEDHPSALSRIRKLKYGH